MNIDTSELRTIHTEAFKIPEYFNRANSIIESMNNVTDSSATYKRNIINSIVQISESLVSLLNEIGLFITDTEAVNAKNAILLGEIDDDKTISSTLGNITTSIDYGLRQGVEKPLDLWKTASAWVYDKTANIFDFFGLEGSAEDFRYARDKAMKSAEETTADNWYYDKYNNNARYMLRNHTSALPYDGKGCSWIAAASSYIPTRVMDGVIPGSGFIMAGMYKGGEMSQESLNRSKSESWQGIEEDYQNGRISEEDYQMINAIRNMSDEEYRAVFDGSVRGEIPNEVVEMVKYYHNLPEEWTTTENINKATKNGTGGFACGVAQYALDNYLDNPDGITGSDAWDSVLRVAGNGASASAEVLYDAALLSYTFDTPYFTELEKKGGVGGVIDAGVMGGVLTLGGVSLRLGGKWFEKLLNNKNAPKPRDIPNINLNTGDDVNLKPKVDVEIPGKVPNADDILEEVSESVGASASNIDGMDSMSSSTGRYDIDFSSDSKLKQVGEMMKKISSEEDVELILEGMRAKIASGELDISKMGLMDVGYAYAACAKDVLDNVSQNNKTKIYDVPAAFGRNMDGTYSIQDEFWLNHSSSTYGAEQGMMKKLYHYENPDGKIILPDSKEYEEAIRSNTELKLVKKPGFVETADYIANRYNTNSVDAARIITRMDADQGICSNADLANAIVIAYKDSPIEFEQTFGFGIDEIDKLELDIYMYANTIENTANGFISKNADGTISVKERGTTISRNGVTFTTDRNNNFSFGAAKAGGEYKYEVANAYLTSKNSNKHIQNVAVYASSGLKDMNDVHFDEITKALNDGKSVRLSVFPTKGSKINTWMMDLNTGVPIMENHVMTMTGIDRYGYIVDNQGHRTYINLSGLKEGKINGVEVRIDEFVNN